MQTKVIKNADARAELLQEMQTKLCRQTLSNFRAGTPAFLFVYTTLQGLSTAKMQTKFVYSFRQIFCRQSLSAEFVYRACLHDLGMQTRFVYVPK
jgi:hypothetical protein